MDNIQHVVSDFVEVRHRSKVECYKTATILLKRLQMTNNTHIGVFSGKINEETE